MFIERPPLIFRLFYPNALFRIPTRQKEVFLTFDDGPIPEATPWILDCLDRFGIKATFFLVGDNARRYPHLLEDIRSRGHAIGNHTMHHIQGHMHNTKAYVADVEAADRHLHTPLFRPPHGWLRIRQHRALRSDKRMVMYDLITRDYSKWVDAQGVLDRVKRYSRPGSIIVFHDSLKSIEKLKLVLPEALQWLISQGYSFSLPDERFFDDEKFYPTIGFRLPGLDHEQMIPATIKLKGNGR